MLSQQELSDRFEIQDLVFHYAHLIDSKKIERLRDDVFTPDVYIDYSVFGGSVGGLEETLAFLRASLTRELFPNSQHLNANVLCVYSALFVCHRALLQMSGHLCLISRLGLAACSRSRFTLRRYSEGTALSSTRCCIRFPICSPAKPC